MAEDSRPPPPDKQSGASPPRRVPGSGGLTPAQIRRGFLPPWTSQPVNGKDKPTAATSKDRSDDPPAPGLPRRVPGTSAIQQPPAAAGSAAATSASRSPEQIAASAARLLRPKAATLKVEKKSRPGASSPPASSVPSPSVPAQAGAPPTTASPPASSVPSPSVPAQAGAPPTTASPQASGLPPQAGQPASAAGSAPRPSQLSRRRSSRGARRWQLAGLLVVIAAVLAAMLAFALSHRHAATPPGSGASVRAGLLVAGRGAG